MSEEHTNVVEIDAIAVEEWDRDQHTPVQVESNRAELVKKSGLDEGWDALAPAKEDQAAAPRTNTNTMRRTGSAQAMPSKVHKTMAMPTVAAVKPAAPEKAAPPASPVAAQAQPKAKLEAKTPPAKPATKTTATRVALAKPGAAPTFSPFGNETAAPVAPIAKGEAAKSAPVAAKPAPAGVKTETTKSAPIARPPAAPTHVEAAKSAPVAAVKPARADPTPAKAAPVATPAVAATKPARPDGTPARVTPVATPAVNVTAAKPARADATPAPVKVAATKPARTDATPPPAVNVVAAKPARTDATPPPAVNPVKPARADATPAKTAAPPKPAPVATGEAVAAKLASAPSSLDLPAWPPAPRVEVAALAAGSQKFEDWDEVGGVTAVGTSTQPPRKRGEDSVIVDLNAVAQGEHQPSRRPQTYPILTSDQGTTTSGVFEMPTAEQPMMAAAMAAQSMAAQAPQPSHRSEKPTSPSMPAATMAASSASAEVSAPNGGGVASTAWHTPLPLAAPPPEPAPQWPSAAGLEYNGAHGSAPEIPLPVTRPDPTEPHLARRTLLATVFPTPTSRKKGLLAAAGALAVVLVIVLVSSGGSSKSTGETAAAKSSHAATSEASSSTSSHAATPSKPSPSPVATAAMPAAATTVAAADTPSSTSKAEPTAKRPVVAKRRISRGKKPVVVDYDKKPDPTPEQDEALTRARTDYAAGNHHLFAGETAAAISSYRQALAAYPNYVAGYRGLGLAYAQQGDKASALDAFKTYVKLAPTAKDVALIQKRIANLSLR